MMSVGPSVHYIPPHEQVLLQQSGVRRPSESSSAFPIGNRLLIPQSHQLTHESVDIHQQQQQSALVHQQQLQQVQHPNAAQQFRPPTASSVRTTSSARSSGGLICSSVLEQCCYYISQVAFVSGTLVGFALIISGAVLYSQRGEPIVFVYIGALVMTVSVVLLIVQCNVRERRKKRRQKKAAHHAARCVSESSADPPPLNNDPQAAVSILAFPLPQQYPLLGAQSMSMTTSHFTSGDDELSALSRPQLHVPSEHGTGIVSVPLSRHSSNRSHHYHQSSLYAQRHETERLCNYHHPLDYHGQHQHQQHSQGRYKMAVL